MRPKQFESLLVKAVIFSLPLIMFIAVPWMEVLSCWGDWIYLKGSLCKRHNELIFKVRCYATTSLSQKLLDFFAQLTNTNKHSNTGKQRHFCAVKKNIVLSLNFVTKNSEQSVIQGLASDKVYCTHNNRQHIFTIFRACMLKNVGASYPLFRCLVPPRGTCTPG